MKFITLLAAGFLALAGTAAMAQETLKMSTVAPGTAVYRTMTTFSNLANQNQDAYSIQVDATGAASKHMIELAQGKIDLCLATPLIYQFLKDQKAMYQKVPNGPELAENIRLIMWFPYGQTHILTYADSGIETLKDIAGKKVFLGPPGGAALKGSHDWILAATGLDSDKGDYESINASWASALQGFQDGQIDVYMAGAIAPAPSIEQLALTRKVRILGLTKEEYESNQAAQDYVNAVSSRELGVIEKGIYGDKLVSDEDVYTISSRVGIVARADLPEDAVYQITRAFWENVAETAESVKWLSQLTTDYAVHASGMPLHPGALRYYEEAGIAVPDGSR